MTDDHRQWEHQIYEFLDAPIPDTVLDRGVLVISDVLAAATAGSAIDDVQTIGIAADFSDGSATILGTDRQTAPGQAAMVNAAAAIAQEIEEGHNKGGHVGAGIVAGGLALAEQYDADGEILVKACVRAYEICVRLERGLFAMKDRLNESIPWLVRNPHSTWTTIGPALAGAICAGLDEEKLCETIRVAANLAVVSMHDPYEEGAPARNFTAGFSAQVGVNAALLVDAGLAGSQVAMQEVYTPLDDLIDGEFSEWFTTLGKEWVIEENYFKFTPSCRYTHPPLDALTAVRDEVETDKVERIDVYTFANAVDLSYSDVTNYTSAKFSIPYVLARYLTADELWLDDFTEPALSDSETLALADRVHLHHDESLEESFPEHWSARVVVTHEDGRKVDAECRDPPGDFRRKPDEERLHDLFRQLFAYGLDDGIDETEDAALNLRERRVREVTSHFRTV